VSYKYCNELDKDLPPQYYYHGPSTSIDGIDGACAFSIKLHPHGASGPTRAHCSSLPPGILDFWVSPCFLDLKVINDKTSRNNAPKSPTSLLLRHESLQHLLIDSSSDNFTDYFYDSNISFDFQNDAFMMKSFHAKYFELRAYKGRSVGYHKPLLSPSFDSYLSPPNLPCCKFDVRVSRVHPCRVIFLHPMVLI